MAVIFVHGVNNRIDDPTYEARRQVIEQFLIRFLTGASINGKQLVNVKPAFPYWGNLATKFAWNMKSLPSGEMESLGPGVASDLRPLVAVICDALSDPMIARDQPLLSMAKQSLPRAVDVVIELVLQTARTSQASIAATFAVDAQVYAAEFESPRPPPDWLKGVTTDEQFCNQLIVAINSKSAATEGIQALGVVDKMGNVVSAGAAKLKQATKAVAVTVLDRTGDFASTKMLAWNRASLNATLGRFFGDVFIYMNGRKDKEDPGEIPEFLLSAWGDAIAAAPNEPVVVIGHSLGGVISYDLLTHFCPGLTVDLFVSVGSQVSHFEEMKLFKASRDDIPGRGGNLVSKPSNIKHWINVFDEVDIFSYSCKSIFKEVLDYPYDTKTYVVKAHGAYFEQARFYERLRARIDKLPII